MTEFEIGFAAGIFDLFNVSQLDFLERAKAQCRTLVVGIFSDEASAEILGKEPVIALEQRKEIVGALRCVDSVAVIEKNLFSTAKDCGAKAVFADKSQKKIFDECESSDDSELRIICI